jgi:uncharacterized protein (DUF342 family)
MGLLGMSNNMYNKIRRLENRIKLLEDRLNEYQRILQDMVDKYYGANVIIAKWENEPITKIESE